jgi:Mitochondrial ribosomal protein (VAR1)
LKQQVASIKTSLKVNDVIYQYLQTFSIFNKRKNGILIKFKQHIGYNFNSKNLLLRGVAGSAGLRGDAAEALDPKNRNQVRTTKTLLKKNIIINYYLNGPLLKKKEPQINKEIATEINRLKGVSGLTGYNRSGNNRLIKYSYKLLFYFFKSMYCLISKPVFLFTPDKVTIQLFYFLNIPKFTVFKWYSILNNKLMRQKWYELRFNKNIDAHQVPEAGQSDNLSNLNKPSDTEQLLPLSKSNKLKKLLSLSNKEMMNMIKLRWRIKKTLFRLNNKRNKVKHILFNLNKINLFKVFPLKFKLICEILSNKFKKPVELHLVRIHQPFHDSNILVNLLSLNIRRNKKFKTNVKIEKLYAKKAVKNLYDYSNNSVNFIPTFLSGIKIRIGGRLLREPMIPRITTKKFERGASSPGKVNFLDTATITKKNRKGSYTIKISSGQNFF